MLLVSSECWLTVATVDAHAFSFSSAWFTHKLDGEDCSFGFSHAGSHSIATVGVHRTEYAFAWYAFAPRVQTLAERHSQVGRNVRALF